MRYYWNIEMLVDLFDPTDRIRNIGRSEAMAEAFIQIAKKNPDIKIKFFDHYPLDRSQDHIASIISRRIGILNKELEESKENRSRYMIMNRFELLFTYNYERYSSRIKEKTL
jgi:hypothetical protein